MTELNFDSFDFNTLANGEDPFKEIKSYEIDERFYTLPKDENGNGQALIIFLPDADKRLMQQVYKINSNNVVNGKKRFVAEFSPTTIGLPDPFQEKWAEYWNAGDKEHARQFARSTRFITNIKVIKDPKKPENEGRIFLYELSQKMRDKLKQALQPSDEDIALGAERREVYNPFKGYIFKLVARKGANGIINYDSSEFVYKPELKIYNTPQDAVNDIKTNGHRLSWFLDAANYKSYDWLKDKLNWVLNINTSNQNSQNPSNNVQTVTVNEVSGVEPEVKPAAEPAMQNPAPQNNSNQSSQQVQSIQPSQLDQSNDLDSDDLDDMIDNLLK